MKKILTAGRLALTLATVVAAYPSAAAPLESAHITLDQATGDVALVLEESGTILWRHRGLVEPSGEIDWRELPNGRYRVIDEGRGLDYLLDRQGNLLSRRRTEISEADTVNDRLALSQTTGWGVTQTLTPDGSRGYEVDAPPVVDSTGRVWAVIPSRNPDGTESLGYVRTADGDPESWSVWEPVYTTTAGLGSAHVTIDDQDRITVAFIELTDGVRALNVLRYEPDSGWESAPQTILATELFYSQIDIAATAAGDVVVTAQLEEILLTSSYDSAQAAWTRVSPLTAPGAFVGAQTLASNRSRDAVVLTYWIQNGPRRGIYVRDYLSPTEGFGPPTLIPGARFGRVPGSLSAPYSYTPIVVDDAGTVTVVYYLRLFTPNGKLWILRANRRVDGVWNAADTLLVHPDFEPLLTEFGSIDYSPNGDVFLVFPRDERAGSGLSYRQALHFSAATGTWDPPVALYTNEAISETRMRVAARTDNKALAMYVDLNNPVDRIAMFATRVFDAGSWGTDVFRIAEHPVPLFLEPATVGDVVVLVYEDVAEEERENIVFGNRFAP